MHGKSLALATTAAFAALSSRKQDIRLHVQSSFEDELTVHMPANLTVKSAPEPLHGETPFGSFAIAVETAAGKVVVKTSLSLSRPRISPSEYAAFRTFCESADRAFNQRLVIGATK
jgi:hypothetical protein